MSDQSAKTDRAILLTPPGAAAIAVVRLIGPGAPKFLAEHFSKDARRGHCVHGELREGNQVIDDPVVVIHDNGADICVHGGSWVTRSTLELAARAGFVVIGGGEADLDAVDAPTILEREMLAYLPLAATEEALRALLGQPAAWRRALAEGGADWEAIAADRSLWFLLHPPRVAIVGAANVGKSTLANQLFGQERSITADEPGTTRDWVGELANLDGLAVMLVDTPGIRRTEDEIEREAIAGSLDQIAAADVVVAVLDVTRDLDEQRAILLRHPEAIVAANKTDRPRKWRVEGLNAIDIIALNGTGVDELRGEIRLRVGCESVEMERARWWTERQREIIRRGAVGELF